ncbi:uncharacterized protein si:dkeyp-97a10.2 [Fundulus heteroclitus]|uniref:uncharacterized protein si:dkeyp-97a10.2 n=1 Tax=Fundulus heteroclitus TaxID=8078 RepID=UPI00165B7C02|nr:uncharacterized protein si:dkeyp-97a10.2 [Fundulus heteroclitus]XP_021165646.2 uncharacterized protein si:dkeyp-97a10.2 [Fundulus heteroclitus]
MDLQRFLCWKVVPLLLLWPGRFWCMSVHIVNEQPVHVIPGATLVLTARIQKDPREEISTITWAREPETGTDRTKVTLATCPARGPKCSGGGPDVQMSLEQQETTLQVNSYTSADSGEYSVTVTDGSGGNATGRCIVREYEAVHHVSVSINTSHSSLICHEAWGTDPSFSWLHERAAITQQVGRVSKDGSMLFVTMTPICGHFTCMVGNRLGYSSATYTAAPCESGGRGTTVAVVCLVLLLLVCGAALAFLLWRRRTENNRGERLYEHADDTA